jgi:hypothetical protein
MFFCKNGDSTLILLMLLEKMIALFMANHITTETSKRIKQSNAERVITQNLHKPLPEDDLENHLTTCECHHLPAPLPSGRLVS